jgi:hypothetical protein
MIDLCILLAEKREGKRPRETVWPSWKDYIYLILKRHGVNVWGMNPTSKMLDPVAGSCTGANKYAFVDGKEIY